MLSTPPRITANDTQHFAGEILEAKNLTERLAWPNVLHFLARTAISDYFTSKTTVVLGQVIGGGYSEMSLHPTYLPVN
jgi:hypothetical protein